VKIFDGRWEKHYRAIKDLKDSAFKGHVVYKQTQSSTFSKGQFKYQRDEIVDMIDDDHASILELGCGHGDLCKTIIGSTKQLISYTLVDNKHILRFAKHNINNDSVFYVDATKIESLKPCKYDILVSSYCLSETPKEYQDYILSQILQNCNKIFIVDGDKCSDYEERLLASLKLQFHHVDVTPYKFSPRVISVYKAEGSKCLPS